MSTHTFSFYTEPQVVIGSGNQCRDLSVGLGEIGGSDRLFIEVNYEYRHCGSIELTAEEVAELIDVLQLNLRVMTDGGEAA